MLSSCVHPAPLSAPLSWAQDTTDARRLEFLPHHFLLCSVGTTGVLRYQDTSTGRIVAQHRTKQGPCGAMRQNPWNAVICLGHGNGTVTMWTPNTTTPVVSMLCHHGPVRSLAADASGRHLVTTGADGQASGWRAGAAVATAGGSRAARAAGTALHCPCLTPPPSLNPHPNPPHPPPPHTPAPPPPPHTPPPPQVKVWDLRTFRPLHAYYSPSPAEWCDVSQRGLLAVGYGRRVQVWKDALASKAQSPYMTHRLAGGTLRDMAFCPYEVG